MWICVWYMYCLINIYVYYMKAEYILLFSIILLIILVFIGIKNKKEGFTSTIEKTIDYTEIIKNINYILNNFVDDFDKKINFTVKDPDGYFNPASKNYTSMNSIGQYNYFYGQSMGNDQPLPGEQLKGSRIPPNGKPFQKLPSISMNFDNKFAILNEESYYKTNISKSDIDMTNSSKTFQAMINVYDDISGILQTINTKNITTKEQIHEYNMLLFTEVLFLQINETLALKLHLINQGQDVSGNDLLEKYGIISHYIVNYVGKRLPAFLYYVLPYYINNTYNLPDLKINNRYMGNRYNTNPDLMFKRKYIDESMISFYKYEECLKLNNHPMPQSIDKKFQY